ncbi:MAG: DNA recombination protein RmuC [Opitutales bacterium]|nr:DNA recombination protein RmuC [Opitutales bacterium]
MDFLTLIFSSASFLILLFFCVFRADKQRESERTNSESLNRIAEALVREQSNSREALRENREEIAKTSAIQTEALSGTLTRQFSLVSESLSQSRTEQARSLEAIRAAMENSIRALREENAKKLDEMRGVVDEKLQSTLEKRIAESFRLVSERLENVHKSLGEMQSVATNIVDLKRVLSNVKTRGTWGEVQLGNLLADILTPEQFERNFKPSPRSGEVVEFAVKLPGEQGDASRPIYLPIDSKFPIEDYERLSAAAQIGDRETVEKASSELAKRVKSFAMDIRNKYIRPGVTTNFAILFLPTEGLYAEIIRREGLADEIQREQRVLIAGPTTLAALLNSLQMGFRTLAIQKNSAEIAKTLAVVKTDFLRFGELLEKISAKLSDAQNAVARTVDRHRIASKRLEKVESLDLPSAETGEQ